MLCEVTEQIFRCTVNAFDICMFTESYSTGRGNIKGSLNIRSFCCYGHLLLSFFVLQTAQKDISLSAFDAIPLNNFIPLLYQSPGNSKDNNPRILAPMFATFQY
jgi:hypothetical protein